jgi:hypothetical protein
VPDLAIPVHRDETGRIEWAGPAMSIVEEAALGD